jgi:hypothetical protein
MFFGTDMIDPLNLVSGGLGKVKSVNDKPVKKCGQILV